MTEAPRIRVSTIHKAKGGEADNVALLLDSTKANVKEKNIGIKILSTEFSM